MGILSVVTDVAGQGGMRPRRPKVVTTDNLSTITASGYLNEPHNNGYPLLNTDVVDMIYSFSTATQSGSYGAFTVSIVNGNVTLSSASSSGDVLLPVVVGDAAIFSNTLGQIADAGKPPALMSSLPVVSGHAVVLSGTAGQLADAGASPILTGSIDSQAISTLTTSATPSITTLTSSVTKSGATMTGGSLIAISGETESSTANGGTIYGIQGKLTLTGTATGTLVASAIHALLDIDSVDLSLAVVSALRIEFGGAAEVGVDSNLYGISLVNSTTSVPNAQLFLSGGADYLFELVDNAITVGPTYFAAAGTTAGSAGDVTKCNASNVLKIHANGVDYWIPLFASNS